MGKLVDAFEDWVDNGHMTRGESLGDFYRRFCRQWETEHPTCGATREQVERLKAREVADLTDIEGALDGEDTLGATIRRLREENERLKRREVAEYQFPDEVVRAIAEACYDSVVTQLDDENPEFGEPSVSSAKLEAAALAEAATWRPRFKVGDRVRIASMPERIWEVGTPEELAVSLHRADKPEGGFHWTPISELSREPLPPKPEAKP